MVTKVVCTVAAIRDFLIEVTHLVRAVVLDMVVFAVEFMFSYLVLIERINFLPVCL